MHGFNYQAIVTLDSFFSSLMEPYVGKRSDYGMMQSSNLEGYLQDLNDVGHSVDDCFFFYGDPAY